ncbi:MAG: M56 family metallopeptidase [Candidatus Latescibacterota bacterium]|nr:MAG: M56 family metallopeptidase [Candidatus Latescibacterota bacterium]
MFWQVSLLILLMWTADLLIRKWIWPQVRYALWLLVLLKLVIPPTWSLPSGVVPVFHQKVQSQVDLRGGEKPETPGVEGVSDQAPVPAESDATTPDETPATGVVQMDQMPPDSKTASVKPIWQVYVFGLWILGMIFFVALILGRIKILRRWHEEQEKKQTIPVWYHELLVKTAERLKLGRLPAIVFSDRIVTPAVCGIFDPVMFLPKNYTNSLSREEAEHVLLHEMAHLKRGDLWLHGLCLLLQIVYWFNPFLILARKQIQHVREICCDLTVADLLREKTTRYRQTLLNTARALLTESVEPGLGLLGVFEEPFRLMPRLRWLEKETWRNRNLMGATAFLAAVLVTFLILPMAGSRTETGIGDVEGQAVESMISDEESYETSPGEFDSKGGDLYIRSVVRGKRYFMGIPVGSKRLGVNETWIGDGRCSESQRGRTIIFNLRDSLFTFIDHNAETYVEAPLPLDLSDVLSRDILRRHRESRYTGEVDVTGKSETFLDKECMEYKVTFWQVINGDMTNEQSYKVWATTDVPVDLEPFYGFLDCLRRMYNRDGVCRQELAKIRGIQMYTDFRNKRFLTEERIIEEVIEVSLREPPSDVYSAPEDYFEKRRIKRINF